MEPPKTLSIADLINRSLPLSGSVSLLPPSKPPNIPTSSTPPKPSPLQNPNPSILPSLNHPSLITGTVHLPLDGPSSNPCVGGCLSFSDGSATVCCAVLDFDLTLLGSRIEVLAWNFVPSGDRGGLLEIVRWGFANPASGSVHGCLSVLVPPPSRDERFSAKARAFGLLRSVSPVFAVPSDGGNLVGFIAEVVACECGVCGGDRSASDLLEGGNCHSFGKPVLVYFYGPVPTSSWHPAVTKLLGVVILITGLKRKLVCVGGEESQLMLVTTGRTAVYQTRTGDVCGLIGGKALPEKSELCTYNGVVTGVYMKGLVVELDGKVWLLLTDRSLTLPHTVRVGALISAMNVHLVYPKYSWVKMLLLGACVKTSIDVKSFSPFYSRRRSQSMLGKFTESLTFSARFWVLLIISCFKRKFAGILSEKDILGSKKVVHMSNFINNSEELWKTFLSQSQYNATAISKDNKTSLCSCEGWFADIVFQLLDATGSLDVVIPDLPSNFDGQCVLELQDDPVIMSESSLFAEAILLPWGLDLSGEGLPKENWGWFSPLYHSSRAEKLLRLHEIVIRTSPGRLTSRKSTPHRTQDTISYPLKKMLKKHHRITIKNGGSMEDSSCLNLSSSGHSNQVLTISEETLLKRVILNACAGPVINVVGNVIDANSLSRVERELAEMQVGMLPIANIWATEVVCTDPLSEARYLLSELSPE
ncbi:hypothetical protein QJS04_geneDACA006523 [Acorus gramineus]|uniref:CST complex subunit CTC1 n=1 Tax=Acorus gramineus TaxID=55184 RepID=A0AAV9AZK7_ACOGR|nr:hypothetical protein QJS04_geneDACA006523 [Acorus gramineus]